MSEDLNKDALAIWNSLKPIIDKEIEIKTRGAVQRRKAIVTTAPSTSTKLIGVTEPFCDEIFVPFCTTVMNAVVGDAVWIEFMYGATNAYVSMFASPYLADQSIPGNLAVGGSITTNGNNVATLNNIGKVEAAQASSFPYTKGADFTILPTYAGFFITIYASNDITITVPRNNTWAIDTGTEIEFARMGTGKVTFSPESGVTLQSIDSMRQISGQYGVVCLKKIAMNYWILAGSLE